ncbi:unnamed protein product [Sphagnum balticum]
MKIYKPGTERLQYEYNHYREIVLRTYSGLSNQQAYDLAYYDNLETIDTLGRCPYYRGTDQRDYFIPRLQEIFKKLPANARIGDFGAGDGQTASMAFGALSGNAVVDIIEPGPAIKKYEAYINTTKNLKVGHAIQGAIGRAVTGYFKGIGRADIARKHRDVFERRVQLLDSIASEQSFTTIIAAKLGALATIDVEVVPSRFYADKFGNLAGFGLLSGLPFFDPEEQTPRSDEFQTEKVLSILTSLRDRPEEFDLGIVNEPENPRYGMWTITQPQKIVTITKHATNYDQSQ